MYCDLMEEIKKRGDVVSAISQGHIPVPQPIALEFAYLQLRMICELIALACLTAHGDVPETTSKRLTKAYNADQIMKALENLHPGFYPVPGRQVHNEAGKVVQLELVKEPHLTKRELQVLYGKCGDFLHRGNLEQLMKGRKLPDLSEIDTWYKKITVLLNHHQIQLLDGHQQLWVIMQADSDGKVHAYEMEKLSGPSRPAG